MYHPWQDSFVIPLFALLLAPWILISPSATAFCFSQAELGPRCSTGSSTRTTRFTRSTLSFASTKFNQRRSNENNPHVFKDHVLDTLEQNVDQDEEVPIKSSCDLPSSLSRQDEFKTSPYLPTGLEPWQEDELQQILDDALSRLAFVMQYQVFSKTSNPHVRDMFQTCRDSVEIRTSTIPGAGRGLFATHDIPPGTIVAFYPIHSMGFKFVSGSCLSLQIAENPDDLIQVEQSAYALFSLIERPLLGVNLMTRYSNHHPRLFVDMNPKAKLYDGWFCGFINDAAMVKYLGDTDYYRISRGPKRNIEIVPFSRVAPFQVGVTTRHVQQGEELFVSYGYSYWASKIDHDSNGEQQQQLDEIQRQEELAAIECSQWIQTVQDRYALAAQGVAEIFEGLDDLPIVLAPANTPESTSIGLPEDQQSSQRGRRSSLKSIPRRVQQSIQSVWLFQKLAHLSRRLTPRLKFVFRR